MSKTEWIQIRATKEEKNTVNHLVEYYRLNGMSELFWKMLVFIVQQSDLFGVFVAELHDVEHSDS